MPCAVSCWVSWPKRVRSSSIDSAPGTGWVTGRPSSSTIIIGTCGICIACAICGTASMSTRATRKRPAFSSATVTRSLAIAALSGAREAEWKKTTTGAMRDSSSTDWKFCSSISTA